MGRGGNVCFEGGRIYNEKKAKGGRRSKGETWVQLKGGKKMIYDEGKWCGKGKAQNKD